MANSKKNHPINWRNPKLDLEETFKKGDFTTLIYYAEENALDLMSIFLRKGLSETVYELRYGSAVLNYFEENLKAKPDQMALFKLGQLSGYVACLERIRCESDQDKLAKARFEVAKEKFSDYGTEINKIVIALSEKVGMNENDLLQVVLLKVSKLQEIMQTLVNCSIVHFYSYNQQYSLTDIGLRVAIQLKKENQ